MSNGKITKAGVIGFPIEHSLSPVIHNYWLEKYNIKGSYEKIRIHPVHFESEVKRLIREGYAGVNVTVPYKEKILSLVEPENTGELTKKIGAANTLLFKNGKIKASNSDVDGFESSIIAGGLTKYIRKSIVLGAGGAARAIIGAIDALKGIQEVEKITIINRTKERAEQVKKDFSYMKNLEVIRWGDKAKALKDATMLINTTKLGMKGEEDLDIDLSHLPQDALVYDIVYNPLETGLLKKARERGNLFMNGLDMLMYQAVSGFALWFMPNLIENDERFRMVDDELRQKLISELEER